MFNGLIKLSFIAVLATSAISCQNNERNGDKEAEEKYSQAKNYFDLGQYESASALLSEIDSLYPKAVGTRRKASLLRPELKERWTAAQLSEIDSLLAVNTIIGDSLRNLMTFVENPLEGYFVAKEIGKTEPRTEAGLHGRISPGFKFYITSSSPNPIKSTSVRLSANGESVETPTIPFDGERNNRSGKCETITFTEAESAPLGDFILRHNQETIGLTFIGENGQEQHLELPSIQKRSIATEYRYAKTVIRDKFLRLEKERLSKQLYLSRQQIARSRESR